jgi:hypothetical protein
MRTRAYASGLPAMIEEFNAHILDVREALLPMLLQQSTCFEELCHRLERHGVRLSAWERLTDAQRAEAGLYFDRHVSPALIPLSLMPMGVGLATARYLVGAITLGAVLMFLAVEFSAKRDIPIQRELFFGSILYLPILWALLVFDHRANSVLRS